jgi:hypothetical protein
MYGHKYTDEERRFFVEYVPGHSYKEIQEEFINRFDWNISINQIKTYIGNHGLNTGRTGCFEKGHIPFNKGEKMSHETYKKCAATMFKKGNIPKNHRPVGSERITKDGYVEIKIAEPRKWALKHRYIWEQANGEIPDGHIIIFRDNDRTNISLDNLMIIPRSINAVINHGGLSETINETKELAVNYAKLVSVTRQRKKEQKEQDL